MEHTAEEWREIAHALEQQVRALQMDATAARIGVGMLHEENERLRAVAGAARRFVDIPADRDGFERLVRALGAADVGCENPRCETWGCAKHDE